MKKYLIILGMVSVFLIAACAQQAPTQETAQPDREQAQQVEDAEEADTGMPAKESGDVEETQRAEDEEAGTAEPTSDIVEIDMIARQFEFEPETITVSEGDRVKLNIESVDVAHGIAIPDFGVSQRLEPGNEVTVEFTADKTGTFTFFCNVYCGSGHSGMRGTLVVE